jgi:hypothetical protein
MEFSLKNKWVVYLLCLLIIILPAYHVWYNYPSIKAKTEQGQNEQLFLISAMSAIPFLGVMFAFFLEWYHKQK